MTRHDGYDVRVAPEVEAVLRKADRSGRLLRARFLTQMDRLERLRIIERQVQRWVDDLSGEA